jgi:hypothetical protein
VKASRLFYERSLQKKEEKKMALNLDNEDEKKVSAEEILSIFPKIDQITDNISEIGNEIRKWDKDKNGIVDANEAVDGFLSSPAIIPKITSIVGGIYSTIVFIMGLIGQEMNWLALFVGIGLALLVLAMYFIFQNNAKGMMKTIDRIALEYRNKMNAKSETNRKLYTRIDGLQEEKYQLLADNTSKSYHISLLQVEKKELKNQLEKYENK